MSSTCDLANIDWYQLLGFQADSTQVESNWIFWQEITTIHLCIGLAWHSSAVVFSPGRFRKYRPGLTCCLCCEQPQKTTRPRRLPLTVGWWMSGKFSRTRLYRALAVSGKWLKRLIKYRYSGPKIFNSDDSYLGDSLQVHSLQDFQRPSCQSAAWFLVLLLTATKLPISWAMSEVIGLSMIPLPWKDKQCQAVSALKTSKDTSQDTPDRLGGLLPNPPVFQLLMQAETDRHNQLSHMNLLSLSEAPLHQSNLHRCGILSVYCTDRS